MKNALRLALLLPIGALALLTTGCAFSPQKVTFAPNPTVTASTVGANISVSVKVEDERDSTAIGHRGTAYGKAASITTEQDIAAVIENTIIAGLRNQGFDARPQTGTTDAALHVELRLIDYDTSTGFWTGGVHIRTTLKARATRGTAIYEQTYRAEREERVTVVPTAETNATWLNQSLDTALTQLLSDTKLIGLLVTKP